MVAKNQKILRRSFRGSLRDKDSSYDLIISEDQIRMTWATRTNHEWKVAHSKSIFPEHVTEMDYYKYDVQTNHGGCIAMLQLSLPQNSLQYEMLSA